MAWIPVACGSNPSKPSIHIDRPTSGAEVHGAVLVAGNVHEGAGAAVTLYADAADAGHRVVGGVADSNGNYSLTWFSPSVANGSHALITVAGTNGGDVQTSIEVEVNNRRRTESIPAGTVKMTPASDPHPPVLEPSYASVFQDCVPLDGPVNTTGAEDSPYITADGTELYTFFTPDASIPANLQLSDGVTGIYRSARTAAGWGEPERVYLNYYDEPALDGCETVFGDELWFCTARAGNTREVEIYVAHRDADAWIDWESAGARLNLELEVGELHLADAGNSLYFHSQRAGGQGDVDIWVTRFENGNWSDAVNVTAVNTEYTDGWPWVSSDGSELWFTRAAAAPEIWRSVSSAGQWQAPERVVGPFAGEPTFDPDGNLYFTHHFYDDANNAIIEADIYVCLRR